MKRTAKERKHPPVKPVTKVELSEKHVKWRLTIVIALIALACVAFAYAVISYFNGDKGWRRIEASASSEINCSEDFVFQYNQMQRSRHGDYLTAMRLLMICVIFIP